MSKGNIDIKLRNLRNKLEKANQIIDKIAKNEKYITPVSLDDKSLFEEFF